MRREKKKAWERDRSSEREIRQHKIRLENTEHRKIKQWEAGREGGGQDKIRHC